MRAISSVTCTHSSRVGVSTSACTCALHGSIFSTIGMPNAAVLPVPVCAWPMRSSPLPKRRDGACLDLGRGDEAHPLERAGDGGGHLDLAESIAARRRPGRRPRTPRARCRPVRPGRPRRRPPRFRGGRGDGAFGWREGSRDRASGTPETNVIGGDGPADLRASGRRAARPARRISDPAGDAAPAMLPRHPPPHRDGGLAAGRWPRVVRRAADAGAAGARGPRGSG